MSSQFNSPQVDSSQHQEKKNKTCPEYGVQVNLNSIDTFLIFNKCTKKIEKYLTLSLWVIGCILTGEMALQYQFKTKNKMKCEGL